MGSSSVSGWNRPNHNFKTISNLILYPNSESATNPVKTIKLPLSDEQFEIIKQMCYNKDSNSKLQFLIEQFNFTDEQVMELISIRTDNLYTDVDFTLSNMHLLRDCSNIPKLIELVKKDIYTDINIFGDNDNSNLSRTSLARIAVAILFIALRTLNFDLIKNNFNLIKDEFKELVYYKTESINKKVTDAKYKLDPEDSYMSFISDVMDSTLLECAYNNIEVQRDFILENIEFVSTNYLMNFYHKYPEDAFITKKLEATLKERCELLIRQSFGPCSKLINIKIDWDFGSMVLFNELNDEEDDDLPF